MGARRIGSTQRLLRSVWPGSNPLRRRTDWFETGALGFVILAAVVAVVLAVGLSGTVLRDHLDMVRAEQNNRHQVTATVLAEAGDSDSLTPSVLVRWGEPPRPVREGVVPVAEAVPPNSTIPIWVDGQGQPTLEPKTRADATQAAGMAGSAVLIGCAWATLGIYGLARWWVQRRRLAAWVAEWERVGPQWRKYTS